MPLLTNKLARTDPSADTQGTWPSRETYHSFISLRQRVSITIGDLSFGHFYQGLQQMPFTGFSG
ncbi:hypothetical protein [Novosphingobium sp. 9U]|uniref:hypothetical protein n=1 Tax=Novosphingobium sp. 9U TaxID=2653158 RepID=UPI0012F37E96|nr:hypothetical protein [Novosphingobium sp. 9U]VWX47293.1 hypothetical protein NOVOSPHI9U_10640 [Novosphingobium sp. 9U]